MKRKIRVALMISVFLVGVGFLLHNSYLEEDRKREASWDVYHLAEACLIYEVDSLDNKPPTDLGQLLTGLSGANALDGINHKPYIVKTNWTADSVKDPWGNAYIYNSTNRTISFTLPDGTTKTKTF